MSENIENRQEIVVIITGASGAVYGLRLIEELLAAGQYVALLLSDAGRKVLQYETGLDWQGDVATVNRQIREYFKTESGVEYFANNNFFVPIASGSSAPDAVVIAPCSMRCPTPCSFSTTAASWNAIRRPRS